VDAALVSRLLQHVTQLFSEKLCPAIQTDEGSKVKFFTDGVVIGSKVIYSCIAGYTHSAAAVTCKCLISGNWSCGPPTCKREWLGLESV